MSVDKKRTASGDSSWKEASRAGKLTIKGIQRLDGQEDCSEVITTARYVLKDGKRYLFYKEYMEDGASQQVRMTIGEKEVCLRKTGMGVSELNFQKGASRSCHYQSVVGPMELISRTRKVHCKESEHALTIKLEYSLYMHGQLLSDYELHIIWEEKCFD